MDPQDLVVFPSVARPKARPKGVAENPFTEPRVPYTELEVL
jgi:hypothetical protein